MISVRFLTLLCVLSLGLSYVPYQAHSFNDLSYLQNIMRKGVNYFKLDVSMATRQSCEKFSTWKSDKKCLNQSQYVDEICCLGMRGDTSSRPYFKYDFNTSDELIYLLDREINGDRKFLFAINFQYEHSFDDHLTEQFLLKLADLQTKYGQNLLIGTGTDSFILEYDRICFSGSPLCTKDRQKIANANWFLQSGSYSPYDSRDHKKRYRNFNVEFQQIEKYCRQGFPSWINKYPQFPLIFWQPSNQNQIQYVLEEFLRPSCMRKHNRTLNGMAMASNIDLQMFQVYMKPLQNLTSWDLASFNAYLPGSNLKITSINGRQSLITVRKTDKSFTLNKLQRQKDKLVITLSKQVLIIDKEETVTFLLDNGVNVIIVTQVDDDLSKIYYFSYSLEIMLQKTIDNVHAAMVRDQVFIFLKYNKDSQKYIIKGTKDFSNFVEYGQFSSSHALNSMLMEGDQYIFVGDEDNKVYLVSVLNSQVIHDKLITYGSSPVFMRKENSQLAILIENSMCHAGILINNNDMNKCNFFNNNQYLSLANVNGMITLVEGTYDHILYNEELVTPCHQSIKLASIMNSYDVDVVEVDGYLLMTGTYMPVQKQDLVSALFCGGSNFNSYDDGVVMVALPTPSKARNIRLQ